MLVDKWGTFHSAFYAWQYDHIVCVLNELIMPVSVVNYLVLAISIAALGTAYRIAVRCCCECILLLLLPRALPRRIHLFRACLCVRASYICMSI